MKVQELFETAVTDKPLKLNEIETADAIAMLNKHCKDALWMLKKDRPIWRGFKSGARPNTSFTVIDPSESERVSSNTSNHYTVLLDNAPYNKKIGLPPRSKSLIASTDSGYAGGYGSVYAIVPFDGVKIGCVNNEDMWDTQITLFEQEQKIENFNSLFSYLGINGNIESFQHFASRIESDDGYFKEVVNKMQQFYVDTLSSETKVEMKKDFMGYLFRAYSANATGHTVATTATLKRNEDQEVWVGGKCMAIAKKTWDNMRAQLKGKK